jgi:hypothetical protein
MLKVSINTRLQIIQQSHSNKNSVVLAPKRTRRPKEQNTQKSIHTATVTWFLTTGPKADAEDQRRRPLSQTAQGKPTSIRRWLKRGPCLTPCKKKKNQSKMDERYENLKLLEENLRAQAMISWPGNKRRIDRWDYMILNLLHSKGNNEPWEGTA